MFVTSFVMRTAMAQPSPEETPPVTEGMGYPCFSSDECKLPLKCMSVAKPPDVVRTGTWPSDLKAYNWTAAPYDQYGDIQSEKPIPDANGYKLDWPVDGLVYPGVCGQPATDNKCTFKMSTLVPHNLVPEKNLETLVYCPIDQYCEVTSLSQGICRRYHKEKDQSCANPVVMTSATNFPDDTYKTVAFPLCRMDSGYKCSMTACTEADLDSCGKCNVSTTTTTPTKSGGAMIYLTGGFLTILALVL